MKQYKVPWIQKVDSECQILDPFGSELLVSIPSHISNIMKVKVQGIDYGNTVALQITKF